MCRDLLKSRLLAISGIQAPPGGYQEKHIRGAKNLILNKPAVFRVSKIVEENVIGDLFLINQNTRQNVADLFVKKGFAIVRH